MFRGNHRGQVYANILRDVVENLQRLEGCLNRLPGQTREDAMVNASETLRELAEFLDVSRMSQDKFRGHDLTGDDVFSPLSDFVNRPNGYFGG